MNSSVVLLMAIVLVTAPAVEQKPTRNVLQANSLMRQVAQQELAQNVEAASFGIGIEGDLNNLENPIERNELANLSEIEYYWVNENRIVINLFDKNTPRTLLRQIVVFDHWIDTGDGAVWDIGYFAFRASLFDVEPEKAKRFRQAIWPIYTIYSCLFPITSKYKDATEALRYTCPNASEEFDLQKEGSIAHIHGNVIIPERVREAYENDGEPKANWFYDVKRAGSYYEIQRYGINLDSRPCMEVTFSDCASEKDLCRKEIEIVHYSDQNSDAPSLKLHVTYRKGQALSQAIQAQLFKKEKYETCTVIPFPPPRYSEKHESEFNKKMSRLIENNLRKLPLSMAHLQTIVDITLHSIGIALIFLGGRFLYKRRVAHRKTMNKAEASETKTDA